MANKKLTYRFINHFKTITSHRLLVTKLCFELGLYRQGLVHDLSKYTLSEFIPGVHYYDGSHSPIHDEKLEKGYSLAWLHHKGRNKHHLEYWTDRKSDDWYYIKIPLNYVLEMICDRLAACMTYEKENYKDESALNYFIRVNDGKYMHKDTANLVLKILTTIKDIGYEETFKLIKQGKIIENY